MVPLVPFPFQISLSIIHLKLTKKFAAAPEHIIFLAVHSKRYARNFELFQSTSDGVHLYFCGNV
jgi:hypothetical protein